MTRKGFCLIEILAVMAIIVVLSGTASVVANNYYKLKNELEVKNFDYSILNMFNYARFYCKNKECAGQIYIIEGKNNISFYEGVNLKSRLQVPKCFCITKNDVQNIEHIISIDKNGQICNACSIEYKDRTGKTHLITIGVGSFYVDIK